MSSSIDVLLLYVAKYGTETQKEEVIELLRRQRRGDKWVAIVLAILILAATILAATT